MFNKRFTRVMVLVIIDFFLIALAYFLSMNFINYHEINSAVYKSFIMMISTSAIIHVSFFAIFKLYKSLWKLAGVDEYLYGTGACILESVTSVLLLKVMFPDIALVVLMFAEFFVAIFTLGFRTSFRFYRRMAFMLGHAKNHNYKNVLIIGAGDAANSVIRDMMRGTNRRYYPAAIIDDDKAKLGTYIAGVKVYGDRHQIKAVVEKLNIDLILLAIPSLKGNNKREVISICKDTGRDVKVIPSVDELINGKVTLSTIREVEVRDLLKRNEVDLDYSGVSNYITGKKVLVTGGGGSIGSEICRQIAKFNPKELIILDIYENNAYEIQQELIRRYPNLNLIVAIDSIQDRKRIDNIFRTYKPQIIFHAAAHKHVPLMEDNPWAAIKNNVFGTLNVVEAADKFCIERFVLISTDKAVNPTSLMGATKRICEMVVQAMDRISDTEFVAVRFGNVLGSNGSVIPLFKKQIAEGGPITLTHKDINRYFMLIPEAAELVLQAGAFASGGEIFVLDMGEPVKIYDLACDMIRFSGLIPEKDIEIKVTGLRPGEKLYEELLMEEDGLKNTKNQKIFVEEPQFQDIWTLKKSFKELEEIIDAEEYSKIFSKIKEIVPNYNRKV